MKIFEIIAAEAKSANRELWDKIRSKGVVPNIDKEKYQARDGLEGPFRLRNGKVVYYDPQEGKYYDPDTDMYISYDDYRKMDEADDKTVGEDVSAQIADLIRKKNSASSPIARKNIDSQIALLKRKRDKTNEEQGVAEGLADDFASMAKSMGMNAKIRKPGEKQPVKPAFKATPPSPEERIKLQQQLKQLKREIDKSRQDKDESFSSRERWSGLLSQYDSISKRLKMESVDQDMAEGDKRPKYVVTTKDKPKKVKPSMGGESPHPYQGKLVGATEAEVSNSDYEFTHGEKPKGQGSWFFVARRGGINFSKDVEGEDYIQLNHMSYTDAKKAAVKWARSKGLTRLFVAT